MYLKINSCQFKFILLDHITCTLYINYYLPDLDFQVLTFSNPFFPCLKSLIACCICSSVFITKGPGKRKEANELLQNTGLNKIRFKERVTDIFSKFWFNVLAYLSVCLFGGIFVVCYLKNMGHIFSNLLHTCLLNNLQNYS